MDKEKELEEMQVDLLLSIKWSEGEIGVECGTTARNLYEKGWRKQKWISVDERLPESEKIVLASAVSKTFRYRHTLMVAHIGHHEFTTEDSGWREYVGDTEYDEENDCFWIPECWYEVNSVEDNGNWIIDSDYDVTHWMPLPEPPKMKGGEANA